MTPRSKILSLCILPVVLLADHQPHAQVRARGGERVEIQVQEFESPMELEFPAGGIRRATRERPWTQRKLSPFVCEGVFVKEIQFTSYQRRRRLEPGGERVAQIHLTAKAVLHTRPSEDRKAILRLSLLRGETVLLTWEPGVFDAEEDKDTREYLYSEWIPLSVVDDWFSGAPEPHIRAILEVLHD
jgi:hypothetical protein